VHSFTPGAGDLVHSRMGVMLLADPAAAFANISRSVGSRRRLAFVLAEPRRNEQILVPGAAVVPRVPLAPLDDRAGPAAFWLGQRSRIATVLRAAALSDVAIEHLANDARQSTHTPPRRNECIAGSGRSLGVPGVRPRP